MKVAIYARVSTPDQSVETQLRALWRFVQGRGWDVHREYVDIGYSGRRANRPELDLMMKDARAVKFKAVLVWRFDRMFRSVPHSLEILKEFRSLGIDFISMTEQIDTTTPAGRFFYTLTAAFGELEVDLIRERTREGMARARAAGRRIGRPHRSVDIARALELRKDHSFRQTAKILQLPVGTLHAAIRQAVQKGSGEFLNAGGDQR